MFDANLEGFEKTREIFFDSFMHYMVQMDLRQGMSKQEYAMDGLLRDLAEGVCGNWAAGSKAVSAVGEGQAEFDSSAGGEAVPVRQFSLFI